MTKDTATKLSLVLLAFWSGILTVFVLDIHSPFFVWLIGLWLIGAMLSSVRKIPLGQVGDVEFVGEHVATWNSGYSLVPPILPFLLFINRYLIAVSVRPYGGQLGGKTIITNEENFHHRDDRFAERKVIMHTSPLGMLSFSVFQNFGRVFFNQNHPAHFTLLSLFFMVPFYVLLLVSVLTGGPTEIKYTDREQGVSFPVSVLVQEMPPPIFPVAELYEKQGDDDEIVYITIENRRYYFHLKTTPPLIARALPKREDCYMVMPGERIGFGLNAPPRFVANMNPIVEYSLNENHLPWYLLWIKPLKHWGVFSGPDPYIKATWKDLRDRFSEVNTKYNVIAEALPREKISKHVGGGLVCF